MNTRNSVNTKKIAAISVLTALALIISWLEKPLLELFPLPLPGFKLGLANIATLFALYRFGIWESAQILLLRITLGALLFGTPVSFFLSISGGLLSFITSAMLYNRKNVSVLGVSLAAAASHMLGQIAAAAAILKAPVLFLSYLPFLLLLSIPTGALTGSLSRVIITRVKKTP
jgi:heptaprenyl diphosphate synthase